MVINMDEAKLRTIAQLQEFLNATQEISFTGAPGDSEHQSYEHQPCTQAVFLLCIG
jgi:hypothetical protein